MSDKRTQHITALNRKRAINPNGLSKTAKSVPDRHANEARIEAEAAALAWSKAMEAAGRRRT